MALREEKITILKDRAEMFFRVREFFREKNILEVDCPAITPAPSLAAHIDLITVQQDGVTRYLHSSPEHAMKRLLSEGIGNIYQLSHVFRAGEVGERHNPEFMMAEWYLQGATFSQMIYQTVEFVRLFVGDLPFETISYREAFMQYAGFDYHLSSEDELRSQIKRFNIHAYPETDVEGRDGLLNLLMGLVIEPNLGMEGKIVVLMDYPASQAALSQTYWKGDECVAERFEIYLEGLELANGYHELTHPIEQRKRFEEDNVLRSKMGKPPLPLDEEFLKALEKGLPDCCGVAVGFDRLMMLRHKTIMENVIPFGWA